MVSASAVPGNDAETGSLETSFTLYQGEIMIESGSSISTFLSCPRKYNYKYIHLLANKGYSSALTIGMIVHGVAESNAKKKPDLFDDLMKDLDTKYANEPRYIPDRNFALGISECWVKYWDGKSSGELGNKDIEWLDVEREWKFSINDKFQIVGKSDGYLRLLQDKKFLYELKTSADYDREGYLTNLQSNAQIANNVHSLNADGLECDGVLYDIIWKPALRLKKEETQDQLVDRMIEAVENDPEKYFTRHLLLKSKNSILSHLEDLDSQMRAIELSRTLNYYHRNTNSCKTYGRKCEFYDICLDNSEDFSYYDKKERKHTELSQELQKE